HAGAVHGRLFAALDQLAQLRAEPVAATDDIDPDRLFEAATRLRQQVTLEQGEQCADFAFRPLPVACRESVESQRADATACCRFHNSVDGCRAGAMPCRTRQAAPRSPAAVAVHDDCDVYWRVLYDAELRGKFFTRAGSP